MVSLINSLIPSIRHLFIATRLFVTVLCLLSFSVTAADKVTASIDQNPVILGSSFILKITANFSIDADEWDNSALTKDFILGRTSTQSQTSYSNGSFSQSVTLTTLLMARDAGVFIIPAFDFDGNRTQPIKISIIDAGKTTNKTSTPQLQTQQNVELKNTISTDKIYIGQQFIYTSKLYIADDTEMQSGNLTNPEAENAVIKQVGKDSNDSEIINGRRFQTITREYAITLNKAGYNRITPSRFEGQISTYRPGYRFANRKPIVIQGKAHNIDVLAMPDSYQGEWLASDFVQLSEEWQPAQDKQQFQQGEPITRTITLTVANIDKTALPDLQVDWPQNAKVYPDKPQLTQFAQQGRYFAQQIISYAIIPNQSGEIIFPEVKVPWFNTQTGQAEIALLPEKKLIISANTKLPTQEQTVQPAKTQVAYQAEPASSLWPWLTLMFATLWLITLVAWFMAQRKLKVSNVTVHSNEARETPTSSGEIWPKLVHALKTNNAQSSQQYLALWFKQQWPELKSYDLEKLPLSKECHAACTELNAHLYAAGQSQWQGSVLLSLLSNLKKPVQTKTNGKRASIIENLNP